MTNGSLMKLELPSERSVILLTCIQVIIGLEKTSCGLFESFQCIKYDFWNKNAAKSEALEIFRDTGTLAKSIK